MNFIINKQQYFNAVTAWNNNSNRTSADHIIYNVIRGHNPSRGFTPVQNQQKLANGTNPDQGYITAKQDVLWKIRDNTSPTPSSQLAYKERLQSLNRTYGIEFTPELIAAIRGALK